LDENVVPSCAGATVGIAVGAITIGAGGVAIAGAQAENNILTNINTETSNLRVFIFSPLVEII
jgi:hypothetical protein